MKHVELEETGGEEVFQTPRTTATSASPTPSAAAASEASSFSSLGFNGKQDRNRGQNNNSSRLPPPGCMPGGSWNRESHFGQVSCFCSLVNPFLCFCRACWCDKREIYTQANGFRFKVDGSQAISQQQIGKGGQYSKITMQDSMNEAEAGEVDTEVRRVKRPIAYQMLRLDMYMCIHSIFY